ncbi:S-layer homology domain-containing protein [Paenibacillus jamilae]|uniref:S-layer homology domain-containing protein n=1 Tax=Paenibacillus jamilae TaxID=114136 RepID=UPI003D2BFD88
MKRKMSLLLAFALLMSLIPVGVYAESAASASSSIKKNDNGLFLIDPKITHPKDYKKIVGFELTFKRLEKGSFGGVMPISALMVARGNHGGNEFKFDVSGGFPNYVGSAKELVTFTDTNLGDMFFANASQLTFNGESVTAKFKGTKALFTNNTNVLTAFGVFGSFKVTNVTWILGNPQETYSDKDESYKPVETKRYNDIPTVENGTKYNYVDIEVPTKGEGPFPVIMWIHGGGWTSLNRKSAFISNTMNYLVSKGYAVVYAEYTLSQDMGKGDIQGSFPQDIYDLKAAVRFIRANSKKYNLDPNYIVSMGESAGGHLSTLLGTTNGNPNYEDLNMGNAGYSSDVQAMVSYFGPTNTNGLFAYALLGSKNIGNTELIKSASPYYQITADAPPLFLAHGEDDQTVPAMQSHVMESKARKLIGDENVTSRYFTHGPHASKSVFDAKPVMEAVEAFITKHHNDLKNPSPTDSKSKLASEYSDGIYISGLEGGLFKPEKSITRAEMATILTRVVGSKADNANELRYEDVAKDYWGAKAIAKVSTLGLMNGYPDGTFKPEQPVTRGEMAALLLWLKPTTTTPGAGFADTAFSWYDWAIKSAQGAGYIHGYPDGTFHPRQELTRAEAIVLLNQALNRKPLNGQFQLAWKDVPNSYWAARDIAAASMSLNSAAKNE